MTRQDPDETPGQDGPGHDDATVDETRTDWPAATPPGATPPGGPPPADTAPLAEPPSSPAPWTPPPPGPSYDVLGGAYPQPGAYPPPTGPYPPPTGGTPPPGMTWAPPESGLAQGGLRFADVGPRFVAWLVDRILLGLLVGIVSVPIFVVAAGNLDWEAYFRAAARGDTTFAFGGAFLAATLVTSVITTVVDAVYFTFLWSSGGRATLGMRLLHLEIGNDADGRSLGMGQAFRRWLAMGSWLGVLGAVPVVGSLAGLGQLVWYIVLLVTTGSSPTRQGLHDRFAGTAIVQTRPSGNAWIIGCLAVVLLFAALFVFGIVAVIFLGSQASDIIRESQP